MREIHILSLGAGVQSTALYLLAMDGEFHLDAAVFADTGDEPQAVYRHLEWLKSLNGPRIWTRSKGRISDDLARGMYSTGQRFASVPFFTKSADGEIGMAQRQCSKEYKVEVVNRCIRRDIIGLKPRARVPKDLAVHQYFGISLDEARRSIGIRKRCKTPHFPLIEKGWTRADARRYLEGRVPHEVPRSACVYCPYHNDAEWMEIRKNPDDWALAVRVDARLRDKGTIVNRGIDGQLFAHRSCVPLEDVKFKHEQQRNMFNSECEGVCGV